MIYETALNQLLISYADHYKKIDSKELKFVFTGITTIECENIIELCESMYEIFYDYVFFVESEVFNDYKESYPFRCYLFFPIGSRDKSKAITKEEVENLYWY